MAGMSTRPVSGHADLLPPPQVWWAVWAALMGSVIMLRVVIGPGSGTASAPALIALGPLVVAAVARFLVLPRFKTPAKAFPFFVAGLAAAEGAGIIGLFLGGRNADTFIGLSLVMMGLYAPVLVLRRLLGAEANPFRQGHGVE